MKPEAIPMQIHNENEIPLSCPEVRFGVPAKRPMWKPANVQGTTQPTGKNIDTHMIPLSSRNGHLMGMTHVRNPDQLQSSINTPYFSTDFFGPRLLFI